MLLANCLAPAAAPAKNAGSLASASVITLIAGAKNSSSFVPANASAVLTPSKPLLIPPNVLLNSLFLSTNSVKKELILRKPSTNDLPKNTADAALPNLPKLDV